ncbi:MAG TPA: NAD(P)-dependent oxidoreductase [Caulobacteraceae bacterium]|jgi:nucleoside-diphosphate-sugar epimerase
MRVLFTGISSFTGLWFARALKAAGCDVVAPLRAITYDDPLRQARMAEAAKVADIVPAAPFGSQAFLDVLAGGFDVLCHHAAEAANHKSPDFDVAQAVAGNTFNAAATLAAARAAGVQRLVLTGSVFEEGEGRGTLPLTAFSPYGLSKTLTARAFQGECDRAGLPMVKFVVPNPFGPFEGQTFQRAVMTRWSRGEAVHVSHPLYGRDNTPVDLLGHVYARAAGGTLGAHVSPSVYAGPVGAFFLRMARETRARTGWACALSLADRQDSTEPLERYNLQPVEPADYGWSESAFWDAYAGYYGEGGR